MINVDAGIAYLNYDLLYYYIILLYYAAYHYVLNLRHSQCKCQTRKAIRGQQFREFALCDHWKKIINLGVVLIQ